MVDKTNRLRENVLYEKTHLIGEIRDLQDFTYARASTDSTPRLIVLGHYMLVCSCNEADAFPICIVCMFLPVGQAVCGAGHHLRRRVPTTLYVASFVWTFLQLSAKSLCCRSSHNPETVLTLCALFDLAVIHTVATDTGVSGDAHCFAVARLDHEYKERQA